MNKLFQNNLKSSGLFNEDSGFIIVDAHFQSFGRIHFINKVLRDALLRTEDELKFLSINSFMPKLIDENHKSFIQKFNQTGETHILNRKIINFVKDKNDSIFPVEILVKFHYS